jgi:GNAT superfamily N-acetyltransferase
MGARIAKMAWTIRIAKPEDAPFFMEMLLEAVNWLPGRAYTAEQVQTDPEFAHYIDGWPRADDLGVLAEEGGRPLGAAWIRFLSAEDPGYGFVAEDVPELTIGVVADRRGEGIGRALLRSVADQARSARIKQISLSVERRNYAQRLYLDEGYKIVDSGDLASDTMVLDL